MTKLYCNEGCQKEFKPTEIITGVEMLEGNIEHHYIECPHCYKKYTSYYLDDEMKQIQLQVIELQKKAPLKIKQRNSLNRLIRKLMFMSNQLKMKVEQNEYKTNKESS